jgi:hypothetical protein
MRSSRVVRESDSQRHSRICPGIDPSILRHSEIWGRQMKQCRISYIKEKSKKSPFKKRLNLYFVSLYLTNFSTALIGLTIIELAISGTMFPSWRRERCPVRSCATTPRWWVRWPACSPATPPNRSSPSSRLLKPSVWLVFHPDLKQCCGSVSFWASWIRIRILIPIVDFFMTFLSLLAKLSRLLRPSVWLVLHPNIFYYLKQSLRIRMFLGLLDPDPAPDLSTIKQK